MRSGLGLAALGLATLGFAAFELCLAPALAKSPSINCDAFIDRLKTAASTLHVDFSHALVVSRAHSDTDVFDLVTSAEIDGALTCRSGGLRRFEAHMAEPASARGATDFETFQAAALRAALGWDSGHAKSVAKGLAGEARDYFAASKERGDAYIAGKTERHEPGGITVATIVTEIDRAFVIVVEN